MLPYLIRTVQPVEVPPVLRSSGVTDDVIKTLIARADMSCRSIAAGAVPRTLSATSAMCIKHGWHLREVVRDS
jgi:hypothetical protein